MYAVTDLRTVEFYSEVKWTNIIRVASIDLIGLRSRHDFLIVDTFAGQQTKLNIIHDK